MGDKISIDETSRDKQVDLVEDIAQDDTDRPSAPPTHHHVYIFKRLRRAMPPPTQRRLNAILSHDLDDTVWMDRWVDGPIDSISAEAFQLSLIYTTGFVGSLIAGLGNVWITDRIGFGLATCLGALASAIAYLLMGTGAHYAIFLIAYAFNGFGLGLQVNNLTSRLPNASNKMMVVQACFGLGGTLAPLAATAFAQHVEHRSYYYFFVAMGVALIALAVMLVAFDMRTEEQIESWRQREAELDDTTAGGAIPLQDTNEKDTGPISAETPLAPQSSSAKMKRIFSTPTVYALMAFSFIYIGIEVAISSWSVTFLRRERGGTAAAGYVTTGFWGGMTVSRIILIPITNRLGYQVSIYLYASLALALEIVIWTTHSLVGNAVCYAFVGFFLGPIYPVALMVVSTVLDADLRGGVMGLMGSVGGAGAAAVPFIAGAIADRFGIWTIQPIAVAMIAAFVLLWAMVPKKRKDKKKKS